MVVQPLAAASKSQFSFSRNNQPRTKGDEPVRVLLTGTGTARAIALVTCLVTAATIGCGGGDDGFASVEGVVLLDGKPLTSGMVTTLPMKGRGSQGRIDGEGNFRLTSGDLGTGAQVGQHRVAVMAVENEGSFSPEKPKKLLVPYKYTTAETSGLMIEVKPGTNNEITLELNSTAK